MASHRKRTRDNDTDQEDELEDEQSQESPQKKQRKPTRGELDAAERGEAADRANLERRERGVGAAATSGVLKSITLKNFMCHAHFSTQYHPKMNFIHGNNGSGKSALLTGITVALGGRAAVTGRAGGLKDLIMSGKDQGSVEVTLLNGGGDSFKPETYGSEIRIQRSFSRVGAGGYKIMDRKGKVISTKRDDLNKILDHMNIQVDNPMNVLTQDNARSFIASTDEKVKYQWFLRGTQLDQLRDSYDETDIRLKVSEGKLQASRDNMPALEARVKKYRDRVDRCEAAQNLHMKIEQVEGKLLWAHVREAEDQMSRARELLDKEKEKVAGHRARAEEIEKELEELREIIEADEAEKTAFQATKAPLKEKSRKLKAERDNIGRQVDDLKNAKGECEMEVRSQKITMTELQKAIDEQARLLGPEAKAEREKKQDLLARLKNKLDECLRNRDSENAKVATAMTLVEEAKAAQQQVQMESTHVSEEILKASRNIENLQRQRGNRLNAFGQGLDKLQREIDKRRWVGPKPLGPLGMYIASDESHFHQTFSASIGNIMLQYAVQTPQDRSQLLGLFRSMTASKQITFAGNQIPPVVTHAGRAFDFTKGDLSHMGKTVLSMLQITNDDAARILVTKAHIERTFVAQSREEAKLLLDRIGTGNQRYHVLTPDAFDVNGRRNEYQNNPLRAVTWGNLFTKDVSKEIQKVEDHINILREEQESCRERVRQAKDAVDQRQAELAAQSTRMKKIERTIVDFTHKSAEIEDELKEDQTVEVDSLHLSFAEASEAVKAQEHQITVLELQIASKQAELEPLEIDIGAVNEQLRDFDRQLQAKIVAMGPYADQMMTKTAGLKHSQASLVRHEGYVTEREEEMAQLQQDLARRMNLAVATARPNETLDKAKLLKELQQLQKNLERANQDTGINLEEASRGLRDALDEFESQRDQNDMLASVLLALRRGLQTRREKWAMFRNTISLRAKAAFINTLGRRGHTGKLVIDHQLCILKILIEDDKQKKKDQTETDVNGDVVIHEVLYKSIKALSGGERSFATISLLLALWEAAECPIRCLDEFDVFMDNVNRDQTMKLLMETAKATDDRQFILITPQDIRLDSNADLKIIRVADPQRNQGVLEFGAS